MKKTARERDMTRGYYAAINEAKTEVAAFKQANLLPEEVLQGFKDTREMWIFVEEYMIGRLCREASHRGMPPLKLVEKDVDK